MSTLSEAIEQIDAQTSWVKGVDLFGDITPVDRSNPNRSCFIYILSNGPPIWGIGSRDEPIVEQCSMQVITRSKFANEAYADIHALYRTIPLFFREVDILGVRWNHVLPKGVPSLLNREQDGRVLYSVNFDVMKSQSSG